MIKKFSNTAIASLASFSRNNITPFLTRHWQSIVIGASFLVMAVVLFTFCLLALENSLLFNGFAIDGAFQLYNPLRRLQAGFVPGDGFQFFHGIGIVLLHYPLFWLFGGDLSAAELSRWLVSPAIFLLATGVFYWVLLRRWWITLLALTVTSVWSLLWIQGMVYPENSLLGLRSVAPVFVLAMLLRRNKLIAKKIWRLNAYEMFAPLLLVVALLCGTEHGLAALIAFVLIELFMARKDGWRNLAVSIGRKLGMYVLWLFAILTVITLGHPFGPLSYALVHIPTDQFWYFGATPNDFLQYHKLFLQLTQTFTFTVYTFALIVAALLVWLRKKEWLKDKLPAFWFAWLTGLLTASISSLGYYAASQFIPWSRMLMLITLGIAALAGLRFLADNKRVRDNKFIIAATLTLLLGWAGLHAVQLWQNQSDRLGIKLLVGKAYHRFITKTDHENLDGWRATMSRIMPIVNQDNAVAVIENGADGYTHGVNMQSNTILVEWNKFAKLLKNGQVVYLASSGRHQILHTKPQGKFLAVTLQINKTITIADGYPNKLVIGERLDKGTSEHLWSMYSSQFEAEAGIFGNNNGYDYIIHALGPKARQQYLESFDNTKPKFVITIRHPYALHAEWVEQTSWPFFSRVLENYRLVAVTESHLLWQRNDEQLWKLPDFNENAKSLPLKNGSIELPSNPTDAYRVLSVNIKYQPINWVASTPIAQKIPRYLLRPVGTRTWTDVSLPPYKTEWSFPIVLAPNSDKARLDILTFSLVPGADIKVQDVSYQEKHLSPENYQGFLGELQGPIKP